MIHRNGGPPPGAGSDEPRETEMTRPPSVTTVDGLEPVPPPTDEFDAPVPLTLTRGTDAGPAARRHIARVLRTYDVGADALRDVDVLVGDVVGHALRDETARFVTVDAAVDENRQITVTVLGSVHDDTSEQPAHRVGPVRRIDEQDEGLGRLHELATSWGTRHEHRRTTVWFTVHDLAPLEGAAGDQHAARRIAAATATQLGTVPEVVAFRAAIIAQGAATTAAARTARDATAARATRSRQASDAAAAIAAAAAAAVVAAQTDADDAAFDVAAAARRAAEIVAASVAPGDTAAAAAALRLAATVSTAAAATADQTARTAVLVARTVSSAATVVADATAVDDAAAERLVSVTAHAVHEVAAAAALRLAADTAERNAVAAAVNEETTGRVTALEQSNLRLQHAGDHDRVVAFALQQAMRTRLPTLPSIDLAARYLTATHVDQVGGDWYDALSLEGKTSLVIGDVVGHDIAAAAVMGQVRNLLRALIWTDNDAPCRVVSRLDRALRDLQIETMATLLVVTVDAVDTGTSDRTRSLRWTNAGHPPPILVHPDGSCEILVGTTTLLLGVRPGTARHDTTRFVPFGSTLLLYTDGLVETRNADIDTGTARLTASLRRHHPLGLESLLDAVIADMVGSEPEDDVAVLVARFR